MYTQQNVDTELNSNFQFLIKELNTYGRTVQRIHILPDKWVLYINPPFNGNNTIEIDYMFNQNKELDKAIRNIRSIPEFEAIRDKNLDVKSRILSKFRQKYDASKKTKFGILRKTYRGKPRKTPEDFYEFYQSLLDLAISNFVSPEQLEQVIKMYEKKTPNEKIILPYVGEYGVVNLDKIQIVDKSQHQRGKMLPVGLDRERYARRELSTQTQFYQELEKSEVNYNRFLNYLIQKLAFEIIFPEGVNSAELEKDLNDNLDLNGNDLASRVI